MATSNLSVSTASPLRRAPPRFIMETIKRSPLFAPFLFRAYNFVLKRLGAMLPDETLRHETREFTTFNLWLLVLWVIFAAVSIAALRFDLQTRFDQTAWNWIERARDTVLLFFGLTPLAITMALIWKTKEIIFNGVFGARQ